MIETLFRLIGWFIAEILGGFIGYVLIVLIGAPFILIRAAFDKGSYRVNVVERLRALGERWLG